MSVNKVILIGNVGQDPKVTYYDSGSCVAQLSLATTDKGYTLQNGTQIPDRTEWHNLIFRNKLAEVVDNMDMLSPKPSSGERTVTSTPPVTPPATDVPSQPAEEQTDDLPF